MAETKVALFPFYLELQNKFHFYLCFTSSTELMKSEFIRGSPTNRIAIISEPVAHFYFQSLVAVCPV